MSWEGATLHELAARWPYLTPDLRAGVMQLVRGSGEAQVSYVRSAAGISANLINAACDHQGWCPPELRRSSLMLRDDYLCCSQNQSEYGLRTVPEIVVGLPGDAMVVSQRSLDYRLPTFHDLYQFLVGMPVPNGNFTLLVQQQKLIVPKVTDPAWLRFARKGPTPADLSELLAFCFKRL